MLHKNCTVGCAVKDIARMIGEARRVVCLTGAGVSAESGVPTFRGTSGLWRNYDPASLATPEAFSRDPELVWSWYDWRRRIIAGCKPNEAHAALVDLERRLNRFTLVTQNVDGLHQRAGQRSCLELHGNIWQTRCTREGIVEDNREVPLKRIPPICKCGALLRPNVVWFGEGLPEPVLRKALMEVERCNIMLVVGTSAIVQPAASFPFLAKRVGAYIIEVNPEETPVSRIADKVLRGKAAGVLPEYIGLVSQYGEW